MERSEIFAELEKVTDPQKEFGKILSNLHYTHFFLMDKYKKILAEYDLSSPQSSVMGIIEHFQPSAVSLEQIKNMILEPNSDVSRIVSRLVDKGYVTKVPDPTNGRKVAIILSSEGQKVYRKMLQDKKFQKITSGLSKAEARQFISTLAKLRDS